jgi:hypothetical protein
MMTCLLAVIGFASATTQISGEELAPPATPGNLVVDDNFRVFMIAHAYGTQNYMCLPSPTAPKVIVWTGIGPQATVFDDDGKQILTHFLSLNPDETATSRATWQHSGDSSAIWAAATQTSTDSAYVQPGAIAWLKLQVVGAEDGTTGNRMSATKWIQRVNTAGGMAPTTPCPAIGARAFVPYSADYVFYRAR